jgi:hypothetical protein
MSFNKVIIFHILTVIITVSIEKIFHILQNGKNTVEIIYKSKIFINNFLLLGKS